MSQKTKRRLLAKSYDREKHSAPPDYALLEQHSRDVAAACGALAKAVGPLALYNSGLSDEVFESFCLTLRADGWIQDLGKASSHFQRMVAGEPEIKQLVRHEAISGMLIWLKPELRRWLSPLGDKLLLSVWGALGHHRKFHEHTAPEQVPSLTVHVSHEDFAAILAEMSGDLGLDAPPSFDRDFVIGSSRKDACDFAALDALHDLQDEFTDLEVNFADEQQRRLLALVKAFGIAADVAASAVAARGKWANDYSLPQFVNDSLTHTGLSPEDLTRLINKWAWDRSDCDAAERDESHLPPGFVFRDFQSEVAASPSFLTLAQAGCGSGKSAAAYGWAREWCARLRAAGRSNFRLFFCLPTTGTTTEHFKDYALESGIDASLTHSRASVDLKVMAETSPQEEAGEFNQDTADAARAALNAERDKIESLALWSTPLAVTTSDTVLGLMANARRSIYSLPALMCGAVVFDEIHAFDEQMFGHMLVFLKNFPRLPILLMTASLPEERLQAIKAMRPDLNVVPGPPEFELLERYRLDDSMTGEEMWREVEACVNGGGKVLWVRNRVEWANQTYAACREKFPQADVNVYHSRLRYKDRTVRHRRVIDRFKRDGQAAILVATQVAEMSLDLSADLLITDLAPVPSLIQRMGRLNRRSTPEHPRPPKVALVRPLPQGEKNVKSPYDKDELAQAARWLGELIARQQSERRALHQRDLSEMFAALSEAKAYDLAAAEERACFFSGLWRTRPGMTRGEGHTVSVIREADLKKCDDRDSRGEPKADWLREHEVAILFREAVLKWERVGSLRVAPGDQVEYDFDEQTKEGTGAKWREK
jgi:CRISPR-associated endonuclease/helicase Cas3